MLFIHMGPDHGLTSSASEKTKNLYRCMHVTELKAAKSILANVVGISANIRDYCGWVEQLIAAGKNDPNVCGKNCLLGQMYIEIQKTLYICKKNLLYRIH